MNRKIKYRVWHKFEKRMYQPSEIDTIENEIDDNIDYVVNLIYRDSPNCIPFSFGEIMQYTGLNDIDGKEIYEGDILEDAIGETSRYKVEWGIDGWYLIDMDAEGWDIDVATKEDPELQPRMSSLYCGMIVVGNIFENK